MSLSSAKNIHREAPAGGEIKLDSALIGTIDKIVFYALLSVIFLSAIPYGTVDAFYKSLVIFSVCVLAAIRNIRSAITGTFRLSEPVILLPLVGILLLAVIQTLPLPFTNRETISWDTYETKIFVVTFAALLIYGELLFSLTNSKQSVFPLVTSEVLSAVCRLQGFVSEPLPFEAPDGDAK